VGRDRAAEEMPREFSLPEGTHIGNVRLQVADLRRNVNFYAGLLGFRQVSRAGDTVALSAAGMAPYHIILTELPGAHPRPAFTTGLYHVAIRVPSRVELARVLRQLRERHWPLRGFADHGVSEAIYLADPDDNGLEIYADRPRDQWPLHKGHVAMRTTSLDTHSLLQLARGTGPFEGIHPQTDIGHVHLQVSDLKRAEAFYHGVLGLDVTERDYEGALFLSAGGYHHHVGLNVWESEGAPPPPPGCAGLLAFALSVPDEALWGELHLRLQQAGAPLAQGQGYEYAVNTLTRDPDRIGLELLLPREASSRARRGEA